MKQKLLFIFALLCMVAQGAWAQNVVDLSTLTDDYVAQDGDVLTGEFQFPEWKRNPIISITDGATVTLSNINLKSSCIECLGDATIILADGSRGFLVEPSEQSSSATPSAVTLKNK